MIHTLTPRIFMVHTRVKQPVRLVDSCGCKMGAAFAGMGLLASTIWYGWQWHLSMLSFGGIVLRVLGSSVAAGFVGKAAGILVFRLRSRRCGTEFISA